MVSQSTLDLISWKILLKPYLLWIDAIAIFSLTGLSNPVDFMYHVQPWMICGLMPLALPMEGKLYSMLKSQPPHVYKG